MADEAEFVHANKSTGEIVKPLAGGEMTVKRGGVHDDLALDELLFVLRRDVFVKFLPELLLAGKRALRLLD